MLVKTGEGLHLIYGCTVGQYDNVALYPCLCIRRLLYSGLIMYDTHGNV